MEINFLSIGLAALVPILVGFIWYNPKVLGNSPLATERGTATYEKKNLMPLLGFTFLFSFFIAFIVQTFVIHQFGAFGMIGGEPEKALPSYFAFMKDYGTAFRTFKHGALHGTMSGLFFAMPVIAINSLFERKSWKYIFIHSGYWIITLGLMGGIICGM